MFKIHDGHWLVVIAVVVVLYMLWRWQRPAG